MGELCLPVQTQWWSIFGIQLYLLNMRDLCEYSHLRVFVHTVYKSYNGEHEVACTHRTSCTIFAVETSEGHCRSASHASLLVSVRDL